MGLSLEQKELDKDKGEKHTSEEPYAEVGGERPLPRDCWSLD